MASDVEVDISDVAIISALNTPGGGVFEWRDEVAHDVIGKAIAMSPVNDINNAVHRGGVVGTYKASWGFDRMGSNGHRVRAVIYNGSDHADLVEFGRGVSNSFEVFSWRSAVPPGSKVIREHGTRGYNGRHVLARAVNAVSPGGATVGWGF